MLFSEMIQVVFVVIIFKSTVNIQNHFIYCILSSIVFYIVNDADIFPAHYTWKVAENGLRWPLWRINLQ
jgi:hypothetical protein